MKVELISYTPEALNLLLRTKNTRLANAGDDPAGWDEERKLEHLAYMRDTIKSSWEFVTYVFQISDVTRAFTHQLVRTRHGSYAQESQRTVDARANGALVPAGLAPRHRAAFEQGVRTAFNFYAHMVDEGAPAQDARGLLPTNTLTSITAQYTLRTLHEMAAVRLCTRTQGEYQDVFRAMKAAVVAVHPWAEPFIRVACAQTGVCIFPRYKLCPLQELTYNGAEPQAHVRRLALIQEASEKDRHEATPIARDGRTM